MAAGYTRQSAAEISASLGIKSSSVNAELNQVQSAFDNTTGHDHSGSTTGVGAKIVLTSAVTGILPLANGGTNVNATTGTGLVNTLLTSGASRLAALNGVDVTGSVTISTTLGVTGAATLSSTLGVTGTSTLGVVNSGNHAVTGTFSVSSTSTLTGNTTVGGTLGVTGIITPTGGIKGTATNDNATAGNVGEYVSASGSGVNALNTVATEITNISLSAGDWDVTGLVGFVSTGGMQTVQGDINTVVAIGGTATSFIDSAGFAQFANFPTFTVRFSIAGATTVRLIVLAAFSAGTVTASGTIRARRVR